MHHRSTRISLVGPDQAPSDLHYLYDRADTLMTENEVPGVTLLGNQIRSVAHNPSLLAGLIQVYQAFADTQTVDRRLIEVGFIVICHINECDYALHHHMPFAHRAGLTKTQLQAVMDGKWAEEENRSLWDDDEWLIIEYAQQLAYDSNKISDALFDRIKQRFTEEEIVYLTMRFTLCISWNKFGTALRLETEEAVLKAFETLDLK